MPAQPPVILAIDTSCDDTSVAVTCGVTILANVIASQAQLHKQYGGVFPTVAKQAHKENVEPATRLALQRAQLEWEQIDAIAVTQGPGLAPALEVGITWAESLAAKYHKPLIPVNHIEGHALSSLAQPLSRTEKITIDIFETPALAVIVSGGHTEFIDIQEISQYHRLGWTIDDAAGECLDKVGRMLDLGYPAGPTIEQFAKLGNPKAFAFPLPMTTSGDYNLSFSGLKTYSRNFIEKLTAENNFTKTQIYDFCASFQYAVFRSICYKLNKILTANAETSQPYQEMWLGGGVAANMELRRMLRTTLKPYDLKLRTPYTKKLCADNAAMIGVAAGFKEIDSTPRLDQAIDRKPRWKIDEIN